MKVLRRAIAFMLGVLCLQSALAVTASAGTTNTIKRGGTLNVADIGLSWSSLDPQQTSSTTVATVFAPMFQGLFVFNSAGTQLEPELATSYKVSTSRTSVTIKLRHGVRFQDGTPMNASAVVYDIQRMASLTVDSQCQPFLTDLTSVVPDGNYAVTLNLSAPYGALINILSGQACGFIASPTALQSEGTAAGQFGANPVGTGPYKFSSEVIDSNLIYTKWSGYWDKGQSGYYNSIDISSISNDQSCIDAVEAGTVQICAMGNADDALIAKGVRSIKTYKAPAVSVEYMQMNMTKAPFNNIWARKAVAQAIDVPVVLKELYHNQLTPTASALTPNSWAYDGSRVHGYPQFNLKDAKQDVAQLPGGSLSFALSVQDDPNDVTFGEAIQSQLLSAGINVQLNELQGTTLFSNAKSKLYQAMITSTYSFPDPDLLFYRKLFSTSSNNQTGLNDAVVDNLLTEARETVSQPQRKVLYEKVQERLAIDLPQLMFYDLPQYFFLAKKLQGFTDIGVGQDTFWTTYLS